MYIICFYHIPVAQKMRLPRNKSKGSDRRDGTKILPSSLFRPVASVSPLRRSRLRRITLFTRNFVTRRARGAGYRPRNPTPLFTEVSFN